MIYAMHLAYDMISYIIEIIKYFIIKNISLLDVWYITYHKFLFFGFFVISNTSQSNMHNKLVLKLNVILKSTNNPTPLQRYYYYYYIIIIIYFFNLYYYHHYLSYHFFLLLLYYYITIIALLCDLIHRSQGY